ncbi:hypothetical protein EON66_02460 [archaeon]|nr:MAG: hypothetical protein EON66_02460 [archaeon]
MKLLCEYCSCCARARSLLQLYSVFMSGKLLILVKRTELQRKRAADAKANAVAAGGDTRATAATVSAGETKKSQ